MKIRHFLAACAALLLLVLALATAVPAANLTARALDGPWPERAGPAATVLLYPLFALPVVHALLP
jgi:hypothetical protein